MMVESIVDDLVLMDILWEWLEVGIIWLVIDW